MARKSPPRDVTGVRERRPQTRRQRRDATREGRHSTDRRVPSRRECARDVRCSIDVMLTLNVNLPVAVYTAALTFAAVGSSSKGKPIWTHFSMPGAKRH